jgi:hypothetical protein
MCPGAVTQMSLPVRGRGGNEATLQCTTNGMWQTRQKNKENQQTEIQSILV